MSFPRRSVTYFVANREIGLKTLFFGLSLSTLSTKSRYVTKNNGNNFGDNGSFVYVCIAL